MKTKVNKNEINKNLKRLAILYFAIWLVIIFVKIIIEIILKSDTSILTITKIIGQNIESAILIWMPFCALPLAIVVLIIGVTRWGEKIYGALAKVKWIASFKKAQSQERAKSHESNQSIEVSKSRDKSLDILRGLFIISMLVGHFGIDDALIKIIYSCHMLAFVFVSGYFYNENRSFGQTLKNAAKTLLLPYAVFAVIQVLINIGNWSGQYFIEAIKKYLAGMILTKDILTDIGSIGPAWFILMLFATKILYTLIQKICKKEWIVTIVVVVLSFAGVLIGKAGYWLPWSIDVAMYSLVIYHVGHIFKKYKVLDFIKNNFIFYFVLTPVWAFMIYKGSAELSRRNYGSFGLGIIGAIAGILTTYLLCNLLSEGCPVLSKLLATFGQASMYVLLVHTLIDEIIRLELIKIIPQGNIAVMIIAIAIELAISFGVFKLIGLIKTKKNLKTS